MNIAGKALDWFNIPNQQLAGEILSNLAGGDVPKEDYDNLQEKIPKRI